MDKAWAISKQGLEAGCGWARCTKEGGKCRTRTNCSFGFKLRTQRVCCPHRFQGRELSKFLSTLCQSELTEFFFSLQSSLSLPQNSVSSLFQNATLEILFKIVPVSLSAIPKACQNVGRESDVTCLLQPAKQAITGFWQQYVMIPFHKSSLLCRPLALP